jgi:GNAT superfamily N-acetyltransferase
MNITRIDLADCNKLGPFQPPGWDDIPNDFRAFTNSPFHDQFKGEVGGEFVAVGAIIYHADTAWLAKIIVHPDHRNKGYGKAITQGLIDRIDRSRFRTIYLDATELGFPVYRSLGFQEECWYVHYSNAATGGLRDADGPVRPALPSDHAALMKLDRAAYGEDRSALLHDHLAHALIRVSGEKILGVHFPTLQQGPVVAVNASAAEPLIRERMRTWDRAQLPATNVNGMEVLERMGCAEVRRSCRMFLGERRVWRPEMIFNRTSGQLG